METTIKNNVPETILSINGERAPDSASLARWSLEALVIEAYREGLISRGKVGELLGLSFHDREAWLKARDVPYLYDVADLNQDQAELDRLLGS